MTSTDADLLVVGAGTTGLALALQAHDHGARVRVVERRAEPFRPSRALIVHPRTLEVLRPLGVTDALLARGDRAPSARLHLGRRELPADLGNFDLADTAFPHLLMAAQADVEDVLAEALARREVEVERGAEVVGVVHEGAALVAHLRRAGGQASSITCRYLAGCDGPASVVRAAAGIAWPGGHYGQEVVLADLELDGDLAPGSSHAVVARGGILFVFALGERATWRLLATRPARPDGAAGQPGGPVVAEELQALVDGAGLAARVTDIAWSARVPLEHRLADAYRAGPLFVVGDAAHVHSPAGGQGMNTGIQDATNLGWKLALAAASERAGQAAPEALLDSYQAERRPAGRRVVALTHLLFWGEAGTGPAATLLRSAVVPAVAPALPVLLARRRLMAAGVRILSQLDLPYRRSPICVEDRPPARHGAGAGSRLPDTSVTVDGRRVRLHEVVSRPGVHLLLERQASGLGAERLGHPVHVHRVDDWPGQGVVAVRPDGFVGYRSATASLDAIRSWLALIAVRSPPQAA